MTDDGRIPVSDARYKRIAQVLGAILALLLGLFVVDQANDGGGEPSPTPSVSVSASADPSVTADPTPTATATTSVSPSARPTPSTSSAAPTPPGPVTGSWPNAANTGVPAGTPLTASGSFTVTTAGQVIEGKLITGRVQVDAANVVIRKSRIVAPLTVNAVTVGSGGSVRLEDVEIVGGSNSIAFANWTCVRCDLSGFAQDGVKLGSRTRLEDSWVHSPKSGEGAHADGAQMQNGAENVAVVHNHIDIRHLPDNNLGNAAVIIKRDLGGSGLGPVLIERNLFAGGNYTVYVVTGNSGTQQNVTVRDNVWKRGSWRYGPRHVNIPAVWERNRLDDGTAVSR